MKSHIEKIANAALLHDIGKFWQRTRQKPPFTKQEKEHFGTYAHALWSAHFIERHIADSDIAQWARQHHDPDTREAFLISLADWLASSERQRDEGQVRDRPEAAPLASVLCQVRLYDEDSSQKTWHLPLTEQGNFNDEFFPSQDAKPSAEVYDSLWSSFEEQLKHINTQVTPHNTWLAIMRKFTSRIPSATPTPMAGYVPDISLYDHSRITAALASCFMADNMSEEDASRLRSSLIGKQQEDNEAVCQLVCGNMSGIQEFIYSVPTKGAAKGLRGRSFALQLITDACARYLCSESGVPDCCIIYNGGGRFYLLLPMKISVPELAKTLELHVLQHFHGQLSVHIGGVSLGLKDFRGKDLSDRWHEAGIAANARKLRKYTELAAKDYDTAFGYQDYYTNLVVAGDATSVTPEASEEDKYFEELGRDLRRAKWLLVCEPGNKPEGINKMLGSLGYEYYPVSSLHDVPDKQTIREIVQINDYSLPDIIDKLRPQEETSLTYRFVARSRPLMNHDETMSFEDLANQARGAHKLGVLRADVDNLGAVFRCGLGNQATLSRVATLSTNLSDFFEGYLPKLVRTEYANEIDIIYAGGDDVFIVGAWNRVFDFALDLHKSFTRFCHNPVFTFSCGIVIVDSHVPLRHLADMAQEAEEASKTFERNGHIKNALTLFTKPIGFEELGRFIEFRDELERMLTSDEPKALPKSFLRRLFDVSEAYHREARILRKEDARLSMEALKARARWQRWRWMLIYGLRKFSKDNNWKQEIEKLQKRILDDKLPLEDRMDVPLRWVELLLREDG